MDDFCQPKVHDYNLLLADSLTYTDRPKHLQQFDWIVVATIFRRAVPPAICQTVCRYLSTQGRKSTTAVRYQKFIN